LLKATLNKLAMVFRAPEPNALEAWQTMGGEVHHAFWFYAAPVNLLLGRDSFFLSEPAPLTLSHDDAVAIINSLNQHFSKEGYHFYVQGERWFMGLDEDPKIKTTAVNQVVNQNIADYLPKGEGALHWAALQNEVQMLLFSHPVNRAREAQGLPVVNSLWCYGLGAAR